MKGTVDNGETYLAKDPINACWFWFSLPWFDWINMWKCVFQSQLSWKKEKKKTV